MIPSMPSVQARGRAAITAGQLVAVAVFVAGCASVQAPLRDTLESPDPALAACANWFKQLDDSIDRAGVRDAGAYRIPGFPYLRADRFLASFADEAMGSEAAFAAWVGHLRALDAQAREVELRNLPQQVFPILAVSDRDAAKIESKTCAARLAREDLASGAQRRLLVSVAGVPDDYAGWKRILGLYPLASIPFMQGVEAWHEQALALFRKERAGASAAGEIARYEIAAPPAAAARIGAIYSRLKKDALGVPQLAAEDRDLLLRAYAPAYEIETTGRYDRFGPLLRKANPPPEVDVTQAQAYTRLAYTRYHGQTLLQLVYTIWFPERPAASAFDTLAGKLDGVVLRVTLDADGAPLVYDSIHPCGCYHMFFPTARVRLLPAPKGGIEWAFAPLRLPAMETARRVVVRIASRTHYVVGVRPALGASGVSSYRLADDDELRSLELAPGVTRSAFGPDGIVAGTERGERFAFWPMGIDNAGAMRQWGRQATAFIGRRHFDDATLIEQRFQSAGGTAPAPAR